MKLKKQLSLLLCGALMASALAGCGNGGSSSSASGSDSTSGSQSASTSAGDTSQSEAYVLPDFMVLSGPTGVGAAKLMADNEAAESYDKVAASSTVEADNQAVSSALINGDADIAAVATNVAATLVNKNPESIQVLAVNTLGVLYILEKGDTVTSMADLAGKTVYATGEGANPQYVLNYLLTENGVDPADVDIQWMTAQEVTAQMVSSEDGICMLPVPAATALMIQDSGVRQALSLSEEWSSVSDGELAMGCIVARTDYIEENPQGVEAFLSAYEDSIAYMSDPDNLEDAAELDHEHHHVVGQVGNLVHRLLVVLRLGGNDDLGALLPHLLQNLVQALLKEVGGVGPLRPPGVALLEQLIEPLVAELFFHVNLPRSHKWDFRQSRSRCPGGRRVRPCVPAPAGRPCHSRR